jgi:uncharacterized protein
MKKILLGFLLTLTFQVFAQTIPLRSIEVTGFAEKEVLADYIEMAVHVKESDNLKKESDFAIREKAVLDALNKLNVVKEDIRVDNFDVYRYGYGSSSNRYTLAKTYIVKVRNMESINDFTIRLFEAGATDVNIVKRVKNDLEKYKAEAVKEAIEKARSRAQAIAQTLNVQLGTAIQVTELAEGEPIPYRHDYTSYYKLANTGAVTRAQGNTAYASIADGSDSPDADLRKMKVSYRVLIQFEIMK